MSLALTSLILLLALAPGVFFRGAVLDKLARRSPLNSGNLLEDLLGAAIPAIGIHLLLSLLLQVPSLFNPQFGLSMFQGMFGGELDKLWFPVLTGQFGANGQFLTDLINAFDFRVAFFGSGS